MSSSLIIVNNNYIIVDNNFSEYIINVCGFRFFLGHPVYIFGLSYYFILFMINPVYIRSYLI